MAELSPQYRFNGGPQDHDELINWAKSLRATYPDMKIVFLHSVAEGNIVAVRWRMTGSHIGPDGQWTVEAVANNVLTFDDNGVCLTDDQAGYCSRTQTGNSGTLNSENLITPLAPNWKSGTNSGG